MSHVERLGLMRNPKLSKHFVLALLVSLACPKSETPLARIRLGHWSQLVPVPSFARALESTV